MNLQNVQFLNNEYTNVNGSIWSLKDFMEVW